MNLKTMPDRFHAKLLSGVFHNVIYVQKSFMKQDTSSTFYKLSEGSEGVCVLCICRFTGIYPVTVYIHSF